MGSSLSSSQGRTTAIMAVPKNVVMADHFSGMQKLPDPVAGCPNFRRVPGYKIYCCGQPSLKAYTDILEKVCGKIWPKDGKMKTFDIHKKESEVEVKELKSLSEVVAGLKEGFPGLVHITLPMCNSASPN